MKYVLTGGPGSGKSSILIELEVRGFPVTKEAAEDIIRLDLSKGIKNPWDADDFEDRIIKLHVQREKDGFIDRSIYDSIAYAREKNGITPYLQEMLDNQKRYDEVFFIESLDFVETNKIRRENYQKAKFMTEIIRKEYENAGYNVHSIPPLSVEERADLILSYLNSC